MDLFELIYTSLATRPMAPEALADLMLESRERNRLLGVTGMLIYHQREFMQLLEGDRPVVQALYARIERDARHQQVNTHWDGPIAERSFAGWSMAFVAPDDLALRDKPGYEGLATHGLRAQRGDTTGKKLLLSLRDDFLGEG